MNRPNEQIESDVARLADLQALIAEATSEANSIKARLRGDYADDPGKHDVAGFTLSVTPSTRFDAEAARHVLAQFPDVVTAATVTPEPRLDGAQVKKLVPPAIYDLCCTPSGDARVSLR